MENCWKLDKHWLLTSSFGETMTNLCPGGRSDVSGLGPQRWHWWSYCYCSPCWRHPWFHLQSHSQSFDVHSVFLTTSETINQRKTHHHGCLTDVKLLPFHLSTVVGRSFFFFFSQSKLNSTNDENVDLVGRAEWRLTGQGEVGVWRQILDHMEVPELGADLVHSHTLTIPWRHKDMSNNKEDNNLLWKLIHEDKENPHSPLPWCPCWRWRWRWHNWSLVYNGWWVEFGGRGWSTPPDQCRVQ